MTCFDVCNGDADGLFALVQLRLAEPVAARLVTGLKHDIELLAQVDAGAGDRVTVLDVSLARNRAALERVLDAGARVRYFDHHVAGEIPRHPNLEAHIDTSREVCTSIIVDRHLGGAHRAWAVAAAYGDNLPLSADRLAAQAGLDDDARVALRALGEAVNYNAYGASEADLMIAPRDLYPLLVRHRNPLDALRHEPVIAALDRQRREDLAQAQAIDPYWSAPQGLVLLLPDAPWSRRVIGPCANALAQREPDRAHAVGVVRADASLVLSVRAPARGGVGADRLCRRFGGGGREGAAAIDGLPAAALPGFVAAFGAMRWDADDDAT